MPRGLGDDPLSRKRLSSAKDATSARPGPPSQQTSHNDVFFRRRTEGPQPQPEGATDDQLLSLGEATNVGERPEITEVTDIVRTAQAVKSTQGAELLAAPVSTDDSVGTPVEEDVAKTEEIPRTIAEPVTAPEPPAPVTQEHAAPASGESEVQLQKSEGFFKRLFGRFGK